MFAGGHFWFLVPPFVELPGIERVTVGYTGGVDNNPSYDNAISAQSGHRLAVQIKFNSKMISFESLLNIYWKLIDPTDSFGQFADRGNAFTTAIYYDGQSQKNIAFSSLEKLITSGRFLDPIVTKIEKAQDFYRAEEKHQSYYKKLPFHFRHVYQKSGRMEFIQKYWQVDKKDLRERLTPLQFKVTQDQHTEPPFENEYDQLKDKGIYVDIVSGEPLFSSLDKYDHNCGWPTFTKPILSYHLKENLDQSHGMLRTEIKSLYGDSHLGHVFEDGPKDRGGRRYCVNSAALCFIPLNELEEKGYGEYRALFSCTKNRTQ